MTRPGIESRSPGPLANTLLIGFNPRSCHNKDFKNGFDTSLLNTQQYKVRVKGKVEQSRERSSVVAFEKGAF